MPVQPNFLERTAFFTLNAAPGVMLDLAGALAYQALSTAVQLDLFTTLENRLLTAGELAQELNLEERGVKSMLQALVPIGYMQVKNGRYTNSKMAQKWLVDNEAFDSRSLLMFWDKAMRELWQSAPDIVRSGKRTVNFYEWVESSPELSHSFQQTMVLPVYSIGPDIAQKLKLPDAPARLLDVGGGHGMFSIMFCEYYPKLQATVMDSATALESARQHFDRHELADRISLQAADMWTADWGEGHDVVLFFNLLHHFDRESNGRLFEKANKALKPHGKVAILDQIEGKVQGNVADAFIHLIALQYYLFVDGRVYTHEELSDMLTPAGFTDIQFHKMAKVPGTSLMTAVKG